MIMMMMIESNQQENSQHFSKAGMSTLTSTSIPSTPTVSTTSMASTVSAVEQVQVLTSIPSVSLTQDPAVEEKKEDSPKIIQTIHQVSNSNSSTWTGDCLQVIIKIPYLQPGMKIKRSGNHVWNLHGAPVSYRDPQIYEVIDVFRPSHYDYDSLLGAKLKLYQNPKYYFSWTPSTNCVDKIFIINNRWQAYPDDKDTWSVL